jgi:hypothetical protein
MKLGLKRRDRLANAVSVDLRPCTADVGLLSIHLLACEKVGG